MNIEMKDFLDKYGISSNKLQTEDGYFIIDKSIADICKEAGVETKVFDYEGYDDWYITGLKKDDNSVVYSMIKVREPMDEQKCKAIAVVFNSMDLSFFQKLLSDSKSGKEIDPDTADSAKEQINKLIHAEKFYKSHDKVLLDYFKDSKSDGSYLIADFAIDKVAHDDVFKNGGVYKLPFEYREFDEYGGKRTLEHLAHVGIYDKEEHSIKISDPDNLTEDEKTALLLIQTGDKDKYAYAAENQFHARAFSNPLFYPWRDRAIKSDAGVGESCGLPYEKLFKEGGFWGIDYKEQYKAHKHK